MSGNRFIILGKTNDCPLGYDGYLLPYEFVGDKKILEAIIFDFSPPNETPKLEWNALYKKNLPTKQIPAYILKSKDLSQQIGAIVCVEELAPGGSDATDGIELAQKLEQAGFDFIVASCGSDKFPPLKYRRATKQTRVQESHWVQNEPFLASAMWLLGKVKIPIYVLGETKNAQQALAKALELGFAGLIEEKF